MGKMSRFNALRSSVVTAFIGASCFVGGMQIGRSGERLEMRESYRESLIEIRMHERLAEYYGTKYAELIQRPQQGADANQRLAIAAAMAAYDDLVAYEKSLLERGHAKLSLLPIAETAERERLRKIAVERALDAMPYIYNVFAPGMPELSDTRDSAPENQV